MNPWTRRAWRVSGHNSCTHLRTYGPANYEEEIVKGVSVLLIVLLFAMQTEATIIKKMSIRDLSSDADQIISGRVVDLQYENVNGYLWTLATIRISKSVKGMISGSVQIRIPGGRQTVNGRTLVTQIEGAPVLNNLDEGVFFLESRPPAYPQVLGWEQGYFRISRIGGREYFSSARQSEPQPLENLFQEIERSLKEAR